MNFVRGCFWHQHGDCREGRIPQSRINYWAPKLRENVERDSAHILKLTELGWRVLAVWECQVNDPSLPDRAKAFLEAPYPMSSDQDSR